MDLFVILSFGKYREREQKPILETEWSIIFFTFKKMGHRDV
jgi:hypothetical protein